MQKFGDNLHPKRVKLFKFADLYEILGVFKYP